MRRYPALSSLIELEYMDYRSIPVVEPQRKEEKKQFINGLMTAARAVGITSEELNVIVKSTLLSEMQEQKKPLTAYILEQRKLSSIR